MYIILHSELPWQNDQVVPQRFIDHCNLAIQGGEFVEDNIEFSITLKLNGKEIQLTTAMQREIEKAKKKLTSLMSAPRDYRPSTLMNPAGFSGGVLATVDASVNCSHATPNSDSAYCS